MKHLTIDKIHNVTIFAKRKSSVNGQWSMVKCYRRGLTALEIMIVIAVLAILLATIIPSFTNFRRSSLLNTETMDLLTLVNRARLLSVSSKNDNQYGIHIESSKVVLFQGATYVSTSTSNEVHTFDTKLVSTSTAINGGGSEIVFEKVTGATSQNATTTLLVVGTTSSTTVLIYGTGVATIK